MYLTEKEIARRAIKYLREYYRYRDRHPDGFFEAKTGQVTKSGIIADGLIRFKLVDEKYFVATIEATSVAKEEEIRYRQLTRLLFWDTVSVAFLFTGLLIAFLYFGQYLKPYYGNPYAFWSIIFLTMFGSMGLLWLVLSRLRRYRYIYSIEQFRQYAVDEQWIAFDSSIFPDYGNKYYDELKRQCLKWGIGLLRIDSNHVVPLMTPSREGEFGERQKADFYKGGTIIPKLSAKSFSKQIMRYKKGAFNQFFLLLLGLGGIIFTFSLFHRESPYNYWDREQLEKVAEKVDDEGPEVLDSWVQPEFVIPFREKVKPYLNLDVTVFVQKQTDEAPKVLILTDNKRLQKFQTHRPQASCKGIPGSPGDDFIIQLGAYRSLKNAQRRVWELNEVGITSDIYSCGCLGSKVRLNCVIHVHAYRNPEKGWQKMLEFQDIMTRDSVAVEEIWLRSVKTL